MARYTMQRAPWLAAWAAGSLHSVSCRGLAAAMKARVSGCSTVSAKYSPSLSNKARAWSSHSGSRRPDCLYRSV